MCLFNPMVVKHTENARPNFVGVFGTLQQRHVLQNYQAWYCQNQDSNYTDMYINKDNFCQSVAQKKES